uniref:FXYD domain-containing ion transport regulator n=1 Tax=Vombatus ursinus TaxID=29139 RepID=A0A4X2M8P5_VOMUR
MVTPGPVTQATSQEPDRFYYDYDSVRIVGLTLATIMFVLGILIILSKKVKCRKSDSRSEGSLGG